MSEPIEHPTTLKHALTYAACGLRVLPIKPGTKRPPMREWVEAATVDPDLIRNWFTEPLYRDHGIGLAMGRQPDGRFIFTLDVDEHDPAHSGGESLAELEATHGSLPETVRSITGSNGLHLLFESPVEVRNGVAGDGLDVRGEGGQIVVAPSVHPDTGREYVWESGFAPWEHEIADAPDWLLDLVVSTAYAPQPSPSPSVAPSAPLFADPDTDSPAEWLRSQWQWPLQLTDAGWVLHHVDRRTGDEFWTRPGKERKEGESAVLHLPDGPFVVFSTDATMHALRAAGRLNRDGSVSLDPIGFYAAERHGGDRSAAARAIRVMMTPTSDSRLSAPDPSGGTVLDGYLAQAIDWPTFWKQDHAGQEWVAEPMIPKGRQVALYAPAKHGKSELAFAVVAAMATGQPILGHPNHAGPRHVVYLDYEMTEADLFERLAQLGYDENVDVSHLHYWLLPSLPPLDTQQGCDVLRAIVAHHQAEAVVIDTMGRAVEGDENDNDTYRDFARLTGLRLKADGVAVLRTDHAGKDKEKGQRGASAKNDDADVVLRVDMTDTGWKLKRTHTRVNWVPDTIVIERTEDPDDGTLTITWDKGKTTNTYLPGTGVFVGQLKAAGIKVTRTTGVRTLTNAAKAANLSKGNKAMCDALKWMKAELPEFTAGPTPFTPEPEPTDSHLSPETEKPW